MQYDTDSKKLRLLADWFDAKWPNDPNPEVQKFLRELADKIECTCYYAEGLGISYTQHCRVHGEK